MKIDNGELNRLGLLSGVESSFGFSSLENEPSSASSGDSSSSSCCGCRSSWSSMLFVRSSCEESS